MGAPTSPTEDVPLASESTKNKDLATSNKIVDDTMLVQQSTVVDKQKEKDDNTVFFSVGKEGGTHTIALLIWYVIRHTSSYITYFYFLTFSRLEKLSFSLPYTQCVQKKYILQYIF